MIKDEYSPYKIVHHPDRLEMLRNRRQPAPLQVHLIPTNRCNQSCSFCAYRMPDYSSGQLFDERDIMPKEKLLETIRACAALGVKAIQFTGGGEPLTHPAIKEALALTLDLGMELALVSNGMALDKEAADILANAAWVRISMDAYSRQTYSLLRQVKEKCYDIVCDNLSYLLKVRKKAIVGVGFVVNAENYHEVYEAGRMCKALGVDNLRISAAFTPSGFKYFDTFYEDARRLAEKTKNDLESESFTVFNLFNDRMVDLFSGHQDYDFCPMKELVTYIGADMNVYTCCILAYNDNGRIGSIQNISFDSLWKGNEKSVFFQNHSPRIFCRLPCMFENKNMFINYCIKSDPRHSSFI